MSYLSIATGLMPNRIYQYDNGLTKGSMRRFKFIVTDSGEIIIVNSIGDCYRETNADDYWNIINYPENCKLVPRWTKEEIEKAKAIKQLFPTAENVKRIPDLFGKGAEGNIVYEHSEYSDKLQRWLISLSDNLFPSLKYNETVELDEIIESEKYL